MNIKEHIENTTEDNVVIGYAVFKEHTLGYLFKFNGYLQIGILNSKTLEGGLDPRNGFYPISSEIEHLRKATKEDWVEFKVSGVDYYDLEWK